MAGKYSGAAYSAALGKSEAALKALEGDLLAIKATLAKDTKLQQFITNPTLSQQDKQAGVQALTKPAKEATTKQLFDVLLENGRLSEATKVIDEFEAIMSAHRGEVKITVTCASTLVLIGCNATQQDSTDPFHLAAAPLDSSTQSRLEKALKDSAAAKTGKSCKITNVVNPNILGGSVHLPPGLRRASICCQHVV